ncbi:DEAD/DEAH box helicase [Siccirubricoccus sp. G192]|uniref:DEAD/DEAH box helicase n=1 Tax=Siccirubricoccus sp. G192 TaxID=2849651 RepID=UPI001C2BF884|nr:AAA domain-containing protein [Siccirubricoccus sp. G192]MBV1800493.1 AAA family ATPase [Siccirubricoccus sp. G192]
MSYAETLARLLELAPAGMTNDQLLWRLRRTGLRLTSQEIVEALGRLAESGIAQVRAGGRWQLTQFRASGASTPPGARSRDDQPPQTALAAIIGHLYPAAAAAGDAGEDQEANALSAESDWRKLLAYYASTQRLDPRGAVEEREDRHGEAWQVFAADGRWWHRSVLRFDAERLPPMFRQALSRRDGQACAVGYPVSVFEDGGIAGVVPALLLPAVYRFDRQDLVVEVLATEPVLNPRWLSAIRTRIRALTVEQIKEQLFPEGEEVAFDEVVLRLGHAVATLARAPLRPARLAPSLALQGDGLHNAAALFLPSEARFTQGAERDLENLRSWAEAQLGATALGTVLHNTVPAPADGIIPAGPRPLTNRQYEAARAALAGPLTVIQGPPGTGKSEVILGLLASIVQAGGTALVVSRNHRALDEIEERVEKIAGDCPLLTRARDSEGDRDTDMLEQWRKLAESELRRPAPEADAQLTEAQDKAHGLLVERLRLAHRNALHVELSALAEQVERLGYAMPDMAVPGARRWKSRLAGMLRRLMARFGRPEVTSQPIDPRERFAALRQELEGLSAPQTPTAYHEMAEAAARAAAIALAAYGRMTRPASEERSALEDGLQAFRFSDRSKAAQLTEAEARMVLRHRPVWAVSALSAASRIPLLPALFDYVIFDEASQCDIASSLPLLGRASRAVVVGDPAQLGFIPQLSLRQEHALMDVAGLGGKNRHRVAQSTNSLFQFAASRPGSRLHFLADQFRSHRAIVDYLNNEFYDGRLVAAHDERRARWPDGFKPGLDWLDIQGKPTREDGGNVNHAEAEAITREVVDMIRHRGFQGSIGVLSPFNAQVALLMRRLNAALGATERASVKVATIDRFQGGEADVVLFSLVVGPGLGTRGLGFYQREHRRLNVAISRARALCLVVGDRSFIRGCRIAPLVRLEEAAGRAPRRKDGFDSDWERRVDAALRRH